MAYLPLSTANLPDPAIDPAQGSSPEDYFNTVLYTGNNNNGQAVTGVGFQPDFVWIKQRTTAVGHNLEDAVRGAGKFLQSETTAAEDPTGNLVLFDPDGFTVGTGNRVDQGTNAYVAWNWKANGSGSTIAAGSIDGTNPTIASDVSANTESGFSIVSYRGNTTAGATIGHGLNSKPEMIIFKNRDGAYGWPIYHESLGATKLIYLNLTNAAVASDAHVNNTEPTDSLITLHDHVLTNVSPNDYIAYCFHSVDGFSKIGYWDNPTDGVIGGPFVYLGFQPAWIMLKAADTSSDYTSWMIYDNTRVGINYTDWTDHMLYANRSYNEGLRGNGASASVMTTNGFQLDFLSNGFKIYGGGNGEIDSGGKYIYMAFAENPFKYSNAR